MKFKRIVLDFNKLTVSQKREIAAEYGEDQIVDTDDPVTEPLCFTLSTEPIYEELEFTTQYFPTKVRIMETWSVPHTLQIIIGEGKYAAGCFISKKEIQDIIEFLQRAHVEDKHEKTQSI